MTPDLDTRNGRIARLLLPPLLLLSGFCGISYEILYTKLLGNLLGNQFIINATVLLTFLLGIGVGTLYAHRFRNALWVIELGIGLYAALLALFYPAIDTFLYQSLPFLGTNMLAAAAVSLVLLALPSLLIGCSIPLFAGYLGALRQNHVFSLTYAVYNIGAALTALAMEFVLLRTVGLRNSTLTLALLNVAVAAGVLLLTRTTGLQPAVSAERIRFPRKMLAALAVASVASAVFQLMMIRVAEFVFGPYNETFSLVLATVLLGIAVGSLVAGRLGLTFGGALLMGLFGLAWILAIFPAATTIYTSFYGTAAEIYPLLVGLKLALVLVLMGLPAVGFGATIPALLRVHKDVARESGQLLFCSSMANALGFLLMAFVLHRYLDYGPTFLLVGLLALLALVLHGGLRRRLTAAALVALALAGLAHATLWDESLLYIGHKSFHSTKDLEKEKNASRVANSFKDAQDVFAIVSKNGKPFFFINGYISIPLRSVSEKLVGAMATMLSPRTDLALVLGMGSGGTASTVGLLFDHTDVVEINKVVLQNLFRMKKYNFDVEHNPQVNIIHDDGIHFIKTTPQRYSLILNTVTTPMYFSSVKLYTTDFLEHVVRALTPDGLYITWVDGRIGDRGIDIVLRTLDHAFEYCWQTYLKSNYYIMACSNEPIQLRNQHKVEANTTLRDYLDREHQMPIELLPYSVISTDAASLVASAADVPVNTIDYPVLEFEMARLREGNLLGFKRRLRRKLDFVEVRDKLSPAMDWKAGEFLFFADLRSEHDSALSLILHDLITKQIGEYHDDYATAALRYGERIGSAKAYKNFARRLRWESLDTAAAEALERALELDPRIEGVHEDLGEYYYEQQDYARALPHFFAEWKLSRDSDVPILTGQTLVRLGRFQEALEWIDTAQSRGKTSQERLAYWRGQAFEGLEDTARAESAYREALQQNPASDDARRALERLLLQDTQS